MAVQKSVWEEFLDTMAFDPARFRALSVRARKALRRLDCKSPAELVRRLDEFRHTKNCGPTTLGELAQFLVDHGEVPAGPAGVGSRFPPDRDYLRRVLQSPRLVLAQIDRLMAEHPCRSTWSEDLRQQWASLWELLDLTQKWEAHLTELE